MNRIRVYYKPVGAPAFPMDVQCCLESFQSLVSGYFEYYNINKQLAIVCNEDGRLCDLPYNCTVLNSRFYGPVFIVGRKEHWSADDEDFGWKDVDISAEEAVRLFAGLLKWRDSECGK